MGAENGDVIMVKRWHGIYDHFGVYARTPEGEESVIHYTGENGPADFNGMVRETSLEEFLNGADDYEVWEPDPQEFERIYSGTETVMRAREKTNEKDYNLIWNNCEHFAVWCKTGEKRARQVNRAAAGLGMGGLALVLLFGAFRTMLGKNKA